MIVLHVVESYGFRRSKNFGLSSDSKRGWSVRSYNCNSFQELTRPLQVSKNITTPINESERRKKQGMGFAAMIMHIFSIKILQQTE
jgi:hypothetical protein